MSFIEKERYLLNRRKRKQAEQIFEGISNSRKEALENWFKDRWLQLDVIKRNLISLHSEDEIKDAVTDAWQRSATMIEVFLLDEEGVVVVSSFVKHVGDNLNAIPNLKKGLQDENYMYGPYCDSKTLDLDLSQKHFHDEVTLLFSTPFEIEGEFRLLCARVLNDEMSNVIQEEDTHIYKDSGDNYLFMIKNNRGIPQGMAISRSRFEDKTFTLGDNLKDGVATKHWGTVQIKEHTELEIMFTDPATGKLHPGVQNTITNGENLDCYPGYPDYRHILVGGKGTTIQPPYSDETWGMMCEGDIADIYHYTHLSRRLPVYFGVLAASSILLEWLLKKTGMSDALWSVIIVAYTMCITYVISRKTILAPLTDITDVLWNMAEGEGDLTKRLPMTTKNEFGEMIRWFNKFLNNQVHIIKRVKNSLKASKKTVKTVSSSNEKIQNSMNTIEEMVHTLSQNTVEQNELFGQTQAEVKKIADSFEQNRELEELVASMKEKTGTISVLSGDTEKVKEDAEHINCELEQSMQTAVHGITSLESKSEEITQIVKTINNVSDQTSLLALNATIEAARAGEMGKGFGVVAGEIKKLSESTSEATGMIADLIHSIQTEIANTNSSIYDIKDKVAASIINSTENIKAVEVVQDITKTIGQILQILSEQSEIVESVRKNIIEMSETNGEKMEIGKKSSDEALQLVTYINKQTTKLSKVIESLEYSTEDLSKIVEVFTI